MELCGMVKYLKSNPKYFNVYWINRQKRSYMRRLSIKECMSGLLLSNTRVHVILCIQRQNVYYYSWCQMCVFYNALYYFFVMGQSLVGHREFYVFIGFPRKKGRTIEYINDLCMGHECLEWEWKFRNISWDAHWEGSSMLFPRPPWCCPVYE